MKFFHLSDLHIGLKLIRRDLSDDQKYILSQVTEYAVKERPDAIVIAGDIYDKAIPSAEAVEIFDNFISELAIKVPETAIMIISGNHDSGARVNLFRRVLDRQHIYMIGLPPQKPEEHIAKVTLTDGQGSVNFYLLPFVRPSMVRQIVCPDDEDSRLTYDETLHRLLTREEIADNERNVLVSHQFYLPVNKTANDVERMDSEIRTVGNIDEVKADILQRFDYAALGHIHKPMSVGNEHCRYSGTPLACSVSEAEQQKGIIMVEMGAKGELTTSTLPLIPRHQVRILRGTLMEVLAAPSEDYVKIILTDRNDLDVIDMQERLRHAFPNLLEIERQTAMTTADHATDPERPLREMDPFNMCCAFLGDPDAEEKDLLQDVINTVLNTVTEDR